MADEVGALVVFKPPRWAKAYVELLSILVETVDLDVDVQRVVDDIIAESKIEVR